MEILVLTSLARVPMHGYELKLELEYKHVEWWAKCEHGHLYAALARLERNKHIRPIKRPGGRANQRVYTITASGKKRLLQALTTLGASADVTYFDIDMFLAGCHTLDRDVALSILDMRRTGLDLRLKAATALAAEMDPHVPAVGRLIMDHRIEFLRHEIAFLDRSIAKLREEPTWGPFLGASPIEDFVKSSNVPLESNRR